MLTRLVLIRHGITKWNKERRYCGCQDIPLSSKGRAQARRLHKKLETIDFDRVYSSDRKRALQTVRIVFNGANITQVKGLREIDFGVLEGLQYKEILKKYAGAYEKWLSNPFKNHIPKSEPMRAFKKRVWASIKKIASLNPGKTIAVVCHGGAIGIFVSKVLKSKDFWHYVPSAASITLAEYRNNKPKIKQFNDTTHLE